MRRPTPTAGTPVIEFDLGLADRRALVTGGTKGIGAAVVDVLRDAGAQVLATARSAPARIADGAGFVAADLSTADGVRVVARSALERFGGIDILVNVFGGSSAPGGGFAALDDAVWSRELEQNLMSAVRCARLRLRPILMTSFAFILGAVPLAIATGAGADSRQVLGTTVVFGMTAATLIGIFIVPVFYVVIQGAVERWRPRRRTHTGLPSSAAVR